MENGLGEGGVRQNSLDRLKEINSSLSNLISEYQKNLTKATDAFHINITDENDMKEFPEKIKISSCKLSEEKGYKNGYCFSLQAPTVSALMIYCCNRDIRKKVFWSKSQMQRGWIFEYWNHEINFGIKERKG